MREIKLHPVDDGITHINVYSRGKTELGRMLSNFYHFPFSTKEGRFSSVEGYWFWLGVQDCPEKEALRHTHGYKARTFGKALCKSKGYREDDNFEDKILRAVWGKFKRHKHLLQEAFWHLPLEHYYVMDGFARDAKGSHLWLFDGIEKMRSHLIETESL